MELEHGWRIKGIVDTDENGNARISSVDDSVDEHISMSSEFWCCMICDIMILEKIWDRAFILPPECNSLHDTSVIRVTRGTDGLAVYDGKLTKCVQF